MSLERHKLDWERLAEADAMWAVLTSPEEKGGAWNTDRFFATGEAEIAEVLAVADRLRPLERGRALDFGCGVGRLTRALGTRYREAVGVDISEAMVAQARQLNEAFPQCEFVVNDAPDLDRFESDSFDFVYSNIVLQHLPSVAEIERYVGEFLRIARPDGLVVFGIPAHVAFPYSLQPRRRVVRDPPPARRVGGVDAAPNAADADADDGRQRGGCTEAARRVRRHRAAGGVE